MFLYSPFCDFFFITRVEIAIDTFVSSRDRKSSFNCNENVRYLVSNGRISCVSAYNIDSDVQHTAWLISITQFAISGNFETPLLYPESWNISRD